ncbi:hypothetical protein AB0383_45015 [Amycolatopsis sp. NPDC051373]|uniref:hypothetical protein n=1 Tax=Amycolatopsis sp. NPDC051373 TaxID=3155801 RepID=UPI00344D425E
MFGKFDLRASRQRWADILADNPTLHVVLLGRTDALVPEVVGNLARRQPGIVEDAGDVVPPT